MSIKIFFFIAVMIFFVNCNTYVPSKECIEKFTGTYKIDTSIMGKRYKELVLNRRWDTVKMYSYPDGRYEFNCQDSLLKATEGQWSVSPISEDKELGCNIQIKQKNRAYFHESLNFTVIIEANTSDNSFYMTLRK